MNEKLRKLQQIEVEILDELVRICEKYGLTYYLYYGTLLGAVRHNGFIPWDDDMDIVLFREDFEKFCENAKKDISPGFVLQTTETDPRYPSQIARMRKAGTKYIPDLFLRMGLKEYGIWVDIYPIDNISNDKSLLFFLQTRIGKGVLHRLTIYRSFVNCKGLPFWKKAIHCASMILPLKGWIKLRDWLWSLGKKENSPLCILFTSPYPWKKDLMPKEVFGEPVQLPFEGKKYNVPRNYDYILRKLYGDYMILPPPEKQRSHEPVVWEM